jgi:hypothetical protein
VPRRVSPEGSAGRTAALPAALNTGCTQLAVDIDAGASPTPWTASD